MALSAWMGTHTQAQTALTGISAPNPTPNVFLVKEQVKKYLTGTLGYEQIYQVPKKHVIAALQALRGTDRRTIAKWLKLFYQFKVIKFITPAVVEFL